MPSIQTTRILGSTSVIGSSAWWWMSYHKRPSKPIKQHFDQQYIVNDTPFSSASMDQTIRRGGW